MSEKKNIQSKLVSYNFATIMNFLVAKPGKLVWFPTVAVAISSADVTLQFDFLHLAFLTLLEFVILIAAKKSSLARGAFK